MFRGKKWRRYGKKKGVIERNRIRSEAAKLGWRNRKRRAAILARKPL